MELLLRLVLAHFLADFTLQTNYIARWKRENVSGGIAHSLIFFACSIVLCYARLGQVWVTVGSLQVHGWIALAALSFLHFCEDEWRVWTIKRLGTPDSVWFFLWDQCIHLILVFVFAPLGPGRGLEKPVLLAILFILVTHFSTIFVYYVEKGVLGSADIETQEKYYSMAERLVIALALLLPGWWALAVIGILVFKFFFSRKFWEVTRLNLAIGSALSVLFGLCARYVFYYV